ncbi:hypothetical protein EB73_34835 [Mycobacterium sp. SWH-M3]|nr:hypothetical protein EB73_34835 [Mycobacterium sp. SWH-M3]
MTLGPASNDRTEPPVLNLVVTTLFGADATVHNTVHDPNGRLVSFVVCHDSMGAWTGKRHRRRIIEEGISDALSSNWHICTDVDLVNHKPRSIVFELRPVTEAGDNLGEDGTASMHALAAAIRTLHRVVLGPGGIKVCEHCCLNKIGERRFSCYGQHQHPSATAPCATLAALEEFGL